MKKNDLINKYGVAIAAAPFIAAAIIFVVAINMLDTSKSKPVQAPQEQSHSHSGGLILKPIK